MLPPVLKVAAIVTCLSSLVIAGSASAAEVKAPPSKAATPIEIPGGEPRMKTPPSNSATPIEIPGKGKPQLEKKPSAEATPIEIPGRGRPQVTQKPSVREVDPLPLPNQQRR